MGIQTDYMSNTLKNKNVLVTGHTGFKGSWLSKLLSTFGANVFGYALEPSTEASLFTIAHVNKEVESVYADIRDFERLTKTFNDIKPEIVIHMAAQPLVRDSYLDARYTYETNVMGTVNLLECVKCCDTVKSVINITTDKVYENKEWEWGYRENENLNGYDPYSNSKSCSELVTQCYKNSFFADGRVAISTARSGNVIGGGDFSKDRIIPDCIWAAINKQNIIVRNPYSIRPYQHVLDPLYAYLLIIAKQFQDISYAGSYNVGPDDADCCKTYELVELFIDCWGSDLQWINQHDGGPHEAKYLRLDCSKLKHTMGWQPRWNISTAVEKTVEWTKCWLNKEDIDKCMDKQIEEFLAR